NATTGGTRVAALALSGARVFANIMTQGDIWKSADNGSSWSQILHASSNGEQNGALAIDPLNTNTMYASDFVLPTHSALTDSFVIKSTDGGVTWARTPQGPSASDDIHAYALAIDPNTSSIVYAGGTGTPNVAKSTDACASWLDTAAISGGGLVYALAIDPTHTNILYATTRDNGVFKSTDSAASWAAKNTGLTVGTFTNYDSIVVDPQNANLLHLGSANGYWFSLDGGETWNAANNGFGGTVQIYGLAMTPGRHLIAATNSGLFLLSFAQPPMVTSVSPNASNAGGGATVTISGSSFQSGASVTFGGTSASSVMVVSATTITATTPAHAAGTVDIVVTNPDFLSGTLAGSFTYTNTPSIPANVTATAQTSTSVLITWSAVPSATSYQIFRNDGGGFAQINTSTSATYTDSGVTASTSHLYRVRAVNASGASGDSASDIATTIIFTDDPIVSGSTAVKAVHLSELRSATDAVRGLAGKPAGVYTDSASAGMTVKAMHVTEIRTQLDEAMSMLMLTTGGYTDGSLTGVVIKAVHFQEIRNRVK
ncbi:MAG TPA: IPT/TIG domain-containing protein, partial [Thermoanaerobaculia bacterium]